MFEANRNLLDRKNISCFPLLAFQITDNIVRIRINHYLNGKLEKNYAPALDNYGQSCFVRSDFLKMKCVCKTQMMTIGNYKQVKSSLTLCIMFYHTQLVYR